MTSQLSKACLIVLVVPSKQGIRSEYSSISIFFIGPKKPSLMVPSTLISTGAKITFEQYHAITISLFQTPTVFCFL